MAERPYSRIYHSIIDDEKFASVYDDDRRLAAWLRLLIAADQAHPSSAYVPAGTNRAALMALVDAGLIDLGTANRFRIHGLDSERSRRSEAARVGGLASGRSRSVERSLNGRSDTVEHAKRTVTNLDETSRDKTRQDEHYARDGLPNLDPPSITALEMRTGHTASQAGPKQLEEYDRLIGDHGLTAVLGAFDSVSRGERMTARQLVWGAVKVLEPFVDPKAIDKAARASETDKASKRRLEQTQKYLAELRSDA